ncbi:MAG: sensor histidine kinase [Anaerolineales bacterium]|nr:sensor histidine kinase [Anaerolineales bacterium]
MSSAAAAAQYRSWLVIPLLLEPSVFGVVIYLFDEHLDLDDETLELAATLGEQIVLATQRDRLQQRLREAMVLEERERLAQEMHDAVTQSIYSLALFAEAGRRLASAGNFERIQEYLTLLGDTAQQAMKQLRLMLYELRPAVLEQVGLAEALRQRLEAVEKRAGIDARLEVMEPIWLPPAVEERLYRICQEALNNALKHASAHRVVVTLASTPDSVTLGVSDDGVGFVLGEAANNGSGLNHIRERVAQLNGDLIIETAPDRGTNVIITLSLPAHLAIQEFPEPSIY